VGSLGLPFLAKQPLEEELSRSITQALVEASSEKSFISMNDESSSRSENPNSYDLSSITASLRESSGASFISLDQVKLFEKALARSLHESFT